MVKYNNYTVVGSPTISEDGIASGFSNNNYVTTPEFKLGDGAWKISGTFTTGSDISGTQLILCLSGPGITYYNACGVYINNNKLDLSVQVGGSSQKFSTDVKPSTSYNFSISFKNPNYIFELNNEVVKTYNSSDLVSFNQSNLVLSIGRYFYQGSSYSGFLGEVDLKNIKIYINNNLIYQPIIEAPTPKIQLRNDTASNWTTNNPVLLVGELAYETDTKKIKIGDGTTAYIKLGYIVDPTATNRPQEAIDSLEAELNTKQDKLIATDSILGGAKVPSGTTLDIDSSGNLRTSNKSMCKWTKTGLTNSIDTGTTVNLLTLITNPPDFTVGQPYSSNLNTADGILKLPDYTSSSDLVIDVRLTGTIDGSANTAREFAVELQRADGTLIERKEVIKVATNDISNRGICFQSYTNSSTDPFITDGLKLILNNNSGQTIQLTGVIILIKQVY